MAPRHTVAQPCPLCAEKRKTLDERLRPHWDFIVALYPDCHMAWGWRSMELQNLFVFEGKSRTRWPHSKHNRMKRNVATKMDEPASLAWDCFRLRPDGLAAFPDPARDPFYPDIAKALKDSGAPIIWSGDWPKGPGKLVESNHFELDEAALAP